MTTRNEQFANEHEAADRLRTQIARQLPPAIDLVPFYAALDEALATAKAEGAREPLALLRELAAFPFQPVLPEGKALIRKLRSFVRDERESSLGRDTEAVSR